MKRTPSTSAFAGRVSTILLCGVLLFGCSETPEPPAEPIAPEIMTVEPVEGPVTIQSLTPGDRACYVGLQQADGSVREEEAAFEFCDRITLIGQRVRLRRARTEVMARSCEGNPECPDRDTVNLIVGAEPVTP